LYIFRAAKNGKMEAESFSETSVTIYQFAWRRIPEGLSFQQLRCGGNSGFIMRPIEIVEKRELGCPKASMKGSMPVYTISYTYMVHKP
jgi:hypothetical protein